MTEYEQALLDHFGEFLTDRRQERLDEVLGLRTRHVTVVLMDLYQGHNASAVLRTCDAFGLQDVHIVEAQNEFSAHPEIALGADRWLTMRRFDGRGAAETCRQDLHSRGYRNVAAVLHEDSVPVEKLSLEEPVALWFGTEKDGLPRGVIDAADELVHVPMYGFVESLNVSVAAALCVQNLSTRLRSGDDDWHLSEAEQEVLRMEWVRKSVPNGKAIERRFRKEWNARQAEQKLR